MLDALQRRFDARKQRAEQMQGQEEARLKRMARIVEQAGVMESLLEDPRYHDYRQLLEEARDTLVNQMVTLRHEGVSEEFAHEIAILQGRIYQLDAILKTPETFLALAEGGDSANGASRQSAPKESRGLAPSAR